MALIMGLKNKQNSDRCGLRMGNPMEGNSRDMNIERLGAREGV